MKPNELLLCAVAAVAALIFATQSAATRAGWRATPVAAGLDDPRGLAVAENGAVYVAEGGHGGDVCSPATRCIGTTSQISRIDPKTGSRTAVVTGLFSGGGSVIRLHQ